MVESEDRERCLSYPSGDDPVYVNVPQDRRVPVVAHRNNELFCVWNLLFMVLALFFCAFLYTLLRLWERKKHLH